MKCGRSRGRFPPMAYTINNVIARREKAVAAASQSKARRADLNYGPLIDRTFNAAANLNSGKGLPQAEHPPEWCPANL